MMKVDHIGYAVRDRARACSVFAALGYEILGSEIDERRSVEVTFARLHGVKVEILSPAAGKKSPIDGYLEKTGSTPYHLCYEVDDMKMAIERLTQNGFLLLGMPEPSDPLGGLVAFLYSDEIGLVEVVQYGHESFS